MAMSEVNTDTFKTEEPKLLKEPREAMSGWPMVIFWIAMLVFACYASTHMVGAGDTWVALACGRHFVNHGVNTVEPFSANSHKAGPTNESMAAYAKEIRDSLNDTDEKTGEPLVAPGSLKESMLTWYADKIASYPTWPQWEKNFIAKWHPTGWIDQNWLTHVIFYKLVTYFGTERDPAYNALVVWKFLMYIMAVAVVYYTGRVLGANCALSAVFACFAMFMGRMFLDIRPAGFSNLFVGVTILLLALATYRNVLWMWLMVPLIVLWSNLHGGYIYDFIGLAPFIAMHFLLTLPKKYYRWTHVILFTGAFIFLLFALNNSYESAGKMSARMMDRGTFNQQAIDDYVSEKTNPLIIFILMLPLFAALTWNKNNCKCIGRRGVLHAIGVFIVGFAGMVIFNPFHLTNLTHTYIISVSKHAEYWRTVNEWHSGFEWNNPVGRVGEGQWFMQPFLYFFIVSVLIGVAWLVVWFVLRPKPAPVIMKRGKPVVTQQPADAADNPNEYVWPKADPALMIIAILTIYMAVQARRFIPIAAMAACPVLAMMLHQYIQMIAVRLSSAGRTRLTLPFMDRELQISLALGALGALAAFSGWFGYWYYKVYLAPWPDDDQYSSVFMRMTASYAKPFCAGGFIRENHLSGNMYNYWTEGGFIAWIQNPDPKTGKTPLQLYMDGRAQAAYEVNMYNRWMYIMCGGPEGGADIAKTSKWVDGELKKDHVWVVLMPAAEWNPDHDNWVVPALEHNPDWRTVFLNNKQEIFVDVSTKQGKDLFMGMIEEKLWYPDEFSRHLSMAHALLAVNNAEAQEKGFEEAKKAWSLKPSQMAIYELLGAARDGQKRAQAEQMIRKYLDDFDKNQNEWARHDGFNEQVIAAIVSCNYLGGHGDSQDAMKARSDRYRALQSQLMEDSRW
jgi:hypothetical protein